ncbi:helix-turn-helix domain-containing protein [Segatella copri]|uniref:XRE family transcriptional regulator n=1 Tax=Segatella copri TaxID=165179 RepID=A0AA93BLG0_9BACT|nr:helix-turn-helix transcriptional regulator [Segatella copri]RHA89105.1 XRE family transcriptional regulator [Segatella copri]
MNGPELRQILTKRNISVNELAEKLNMSQPNLSNQFRVQDVKSGVLERICDALDVKMDFFYEGTKYLDDSSSLDNSLGLDHLDERPTEGMSDNDKDKEISYLRGQIKVLEKINEKLLNKTQTVGQSVTYKKKHA